MLWSGFGPECSLHVPRASHEVQRLELSVRELRVLDDYMALWFHEDGSGFLSNYDISSLTFRMKRLLCSSSTAKPLKSIK